MERLSVRVEENLISFRISIAPVPPYSIKVTLFLSYQKGKMTRIVDILTLMDELQCLKISQKIAGIA